MQRTSASPYLGPATNQSRVVLLPVASGLVNPVLSVDGTLIFGSQDTLYAVSNYGAGSQLWQLPSGSFQLNEGASLTISADGTLYGTAAQGHLYAVNTLTNPPTMKWAAPFYLGSYSAIMGSPAIGADGTIYFVGADAYLVSSLVAVEPVAGTHEWTLAGAGCYGCSVAVGHDGNVYTSSDTDYNLYAVFPNGTTYWKYFTSTGTKCTGSPSVAPDGTVYYACGDGNVYALFSNGTLRWKTQPGAGGAGDQMNPAIGLDGTLYVPNPFDNTLYANGTLRWSYTTGGPEQSGAVVAADGSVYFGAGGLDQHIYALRANGTLRWRYNGGNYQFPRLGALITPSGSLHYPVYHGGGLIAFDV